MKTQEIKASDVKIGDRIVSRYMGDRGMAIRDTPRVVDPLHVTIIDGRARGGCIGCEGGAFYNVKGADELVEIVERTEGEAP